MRAEVEAQSADLDPADRAEKYARMAESPFAFFRGTNHLFWADFAEDPQLSEYGGTEETRTWIQGDLHAYNYGTFDNDEGQVVYDLNDFDEAVVADYQFDVWRMAVSIALIANANGIDDVDGVVDAFSESYLDTLADDRGNDGELERIFTADNSYGRLDELLADVEGERSRARMLEDWTELTDAGRRFAFDSPKLAEVDADLAAALEAAMSDYGATLSGGLDWDPEYFRVLSIAARLGAGVGSLGTPRFYVLIEGPSDDPGDDVILDVKRQGLATALRYLSDETVANHEGFFLHGAERAARGQRALGVDVDDHVGWLTLDDGSYTVRARSPFKDEFDTAELDSNTRLTNLAEQWGIILASAHARADRDFDPDLVPYSFDRRRAHRRRPPRLPPARARSRGGLRRASRAGLRRLPRAVSLLEGAPPAPPPWPANFSVSVGGNAGARGVLGWPRGRSIASPRAQAHFA